MILGYDKVMITNLWS